MKRDKLISIDAMSRIDLFNGGGDTIEYIKSEEIKLEEKLYLVGYNSIYLFIPSNNTIVSEKQFQ
jgi:hypothetical protein